MTASREIEEHILRVAAAVPWLSENPPQFRWGGQSMIEDRGEIFPFLEVDPDHPGVRRLADKHGLVAGTTAVTDVSSTVTDGGWFCAAGIPAVIYGPGELRHAHAVDEQVSVDQLKTFTKVILSFIEDWSRTPSSR